MHSARRTDTRVPSTMRRAIAFTHSSAHQGRTQPDRSDILCVRWKVAVRRPCHESRAEKRDEGGIDEHARAIAPLIQPAMREHSKISRSCPSARPTICAAPVTSPHHATLRLGYRSDSGAPELAVHSLPATARDRNSRQSRRKETCSSIGRSAADVAGDRVVLVPFCCGREVLQPISTC